MKTIKIDFEVLTNKKLRPNAKLLYGLLQATDCKISNNEIKSILKLKGTGSVSLLIKNLIDNGLIIREFDAGMKRSLKIVKR